MTKEKRARIELQVSYILGQVDQESRRVISWHLLKKNLTPAEREIFERIEDVGRVKLGKKKG